MTSAFFTRNLGFLLAEKNFIKRNTPLWKTLIKFIAILMMPAKLSTPGLLKRTVFLAKNAMASTANGPVQLYFTC